MRARWPSGLRRQDGASIWSTGVGSNPALVIILLSQELTQLSTTIFEKLVGNNMR